MCALFKFQNLIPKLLILEFHFFDLRIKIKKSPREHFSMNTPALGIQKHTHYTYNVTEIQKMIESHLAQ